MSEITSYLSDYLQELDRYMKRLNEDGLSRKDRKLFLELSNEYYDIFRQSEEFPKDIVDGMAEFNDNIINQSAEGRELAGRYRDNIVRYASDYIDRSMQTELQFGVFQKDVEIRQLQEEKIQMLQELSDLDMKLYGQITEQTQEILAVQGCEILTGRVRELAPWEQADYSVPETETYQEKARDKTEKQEKVEVQEQQRVRFRFPYMKRETFMKVKDEIKRMGAKFDSDPEKKGWYVEKSAGQDVIDAINNYLAEHDEAIYLKLPYAEEAQKFKQILEEIKQKGARYNPIKKRWYITEAMDRSEFFAYLQREDNSVHEKLTGYKAEAEKRADNHEMGFQKREMPERA